MVWCGVAIQRLSTYGLFMNQTCMLLIAHEFVSHGHLHVFVFVCANFESNKMAENKAVVCVSHLHSDMFSFRQVPWNP